MFAAMGVALGDAGGSFSKKLTSDFFVFYRRIHPCLVRDTPVHGLFQYRAQIHILCPAPVCPLHGLDRILSTRRKQ